MNIQYSLQEQMDGHGFELILLEQLVSKRGLQCKSPGLRYEYN